MALFRRIWRVTIGTLRVVPPIRVAFEIERTARPQPNKATVDIWNLTRDHQGQIEQAEAAQVIVEAGYEDDRGAEQLFRGELFRARANQAPTLKSERDAADVVTHIEARDAGTAFQRARVERSFEPGVRVTTVLRACVDALGVGPGNLSEVDTVAEHAVGGATYPEGTVLSGQASRELTRILRGLDLRWSVQHGALQVLRRGAPLQAQAVRLTPSTGLVGSPEVGSRGKVTVNALLTPDLYPGRVVLVQSERLEGRYAVGSVTYRGDSHGDEWLAVCELQPEAA